MRTQTRKNIELTIDRTLSTPVYQQIYQDLRQLIISEALLAGERLPSVRQVAQQVGVSRPTVERAYQQLVVEGYVDSAERSGFVVRRLDTSFLKKMPHGASGERTQKPIEIPHERRAFFEEYETPTWAHYDFAYTRLPKGSFPAREWLRCVDDSVYGDNSRVLEGYPRELHVNDLQVQLCRYLRRVRGVECQPEQVIVFPSTEVALETILQLFTSTHDTLGLEEPGFVTFWQVARRLGFSVASLSCDEGAQHFLDDLSAAQPHLVFLTPSHQFPTGHVMGMDMRIELLKWASEHDSFILEDDSCSEYRFDVDPVPSLASLDGSKRVIYLGNFSKTLSPTLRVAFAVMPYNLIDRYLSTFATSSTYVSLITQIALARFIESGEYDRQVRRMVAALRERHDELLRCLRAEFGDTLELSGIHAGMHLLATVKCASEKALSQEELLAAAAAQGARAYPTQLYWFSRPAPANRVMIGFSAIEPEDIEPGVQALHTAWR